MKKLLILAVAAAALAACSKKQETAQQPSSENDSVSMGSALKDAKAAMQQNADQRANALSGKSKK